MKNKNFIRLNVNDNYLSFGNLLRIIKEESNSQSSFMQSDIFCILFNTEDIADSTVNNYCTGLRAINSQYKAYYQNLKNNFNENFFVNNIIKILELVEYKCYESKDYTLKTINNNLYLKNICNRLYTISKNDSDVNISFSNKLFYFLEEDNLFEFFISILFYVILDKKQPIYVNKSINNIIEKNIYNTNISVNNIQDFINLQLNSGIWSIRGIKQLALQNNPFACFEMASMEFYGIINGISRYEESYKYYKIAADNNHPVANWAIGYLYYKGYIGKKSKHDLFLSLKYFNRAKRMNCSNAFNSLGLILLNKNFPHIKVNTKKAIDYFERAISLGNIYANNNIGNLYENEKDYNRAINYYLISANSGDSWACNRVGEFYRKGLGIKKNLSKAFEYYNLSSESPQFTLCPWSKYNLSMYFYKDGLVELNIPKKLDKAIELLDSISDDLIESNIELINIYFTLYLQSNKKKNFYLEKLYFYKNKCENNPNFNKKIKNLIEKKLYNLKNDFIEIPL